MSINSDYQEQIFKDTGRTVSLASVQCSLCAGICIYHGKPCDACFGKGETEEWVFDDCGHEVEISEGEYSGCEYCCAGIPKDVEESLTTPALRKDIAA